MLHRWNPIFTVQVSSLFFCTKDDSVKYNLLPLRATTFTIDIYREQYKKKIANTQNEPNWRVSAISLQEAKGKVPFCDWNILKNVNFESTKTYFTF